ncbi:hypothetical protein AFB00_27630 [Pseudonocardia sp. HH130630-07]|nr:hypothetical protein AFB00_27630 [Pseudonocardia sp. HH130630-07]
MARVDSPTPLSAASSARARCMSTLASKFSGAHHPEFCRMSSAARTLRGRTDPLRKPRAIGEWATSPIPSSSRVGSRCSVSRAKMEYSACRTETGWTAWARRTPSASVFDSPRWRTLPASTSSFTAPATSSTGTSGSGWCC